MPISFSASLGAGSWTTTFPATRSAPRLAETEPSAAFVATLWGSRHRQGDDALEWCFSTNRNASHWCLFRPAGFTKRHAHIHYLGDSHHNPVRCPAVAEETEAPQGEITSSRSSSESDRARLEPSSVSEFQSLRCVLTAWLPAARGAGLVNAPCSESFPGNRTHPTLLQITSCCQLTISYHILPCDL